MTIFLSNSLGQRNNLKYPTEATINTADEMKAAMNHDMIMGKRTNDEREKNSSWLWSDCIFGDVDHGLSMESFHERYMGYEYFLATSKSHQKKKGELPPEDRFHVFFPIEKISDATEYAALLAALSSKEGFDQSVKDPGRFFFGNPDAEVRHNMGEPITSLLYRGLQIQVTQNQQTVPSDHKMPLAEMTEGSGRNHRLFAIGSGMLADHVPASELVDGMREVNKKFGKPLSDSERDSIINQVFNSALPKEIQKLLSTEVAPKEPGDWFASLLTCGHTEKEMVKMPITPPRQFINGLVAEGSTILYAPPKWGKSWLALQMARAVANGADIFQRETLKSNVIYLAAEDHLAQICERVKIQKGTASDDLHIYSNFLHYLADSSPITVIDQLVTHHKADFIIIDTFNAFFGFEEGSGNAYQNDAKQIKPIHNLAKRLGIGLLVIHHTRKNRTGGFNDVNGSNAFLGGFDVNIQCTQDRITTQSRILQDTYINIVFNKETLCWEEGNTGHDDPMKRAFEQIITDELAHEMKPMKALISATKSADSVTYSDKYISKRIGEMVREGYLTTQSRGKNQVYGIKERPYDQ